MKIKDFTLLTEEKRLSALQLILSETPLVQIMAKTKLSMDQILLVDQIVWDLEKLRCDCGCEFYEL